MITEMNGILLVFWMVTFHSFLQPSFAMAVNSTTGSWEDGGETQELCRERGLLAETASFQRRSCSMCYQYLFPKDKPLRPKPPSFEYMHYVRPSNGALLLPGLIPADIVNKSARLLICSTLKHEECYRWMECCRAAKACCQRQKSMDGNNGHSPDFCGRTWDGYSCWDDTPVGTEVTQQCPSFMMEYSLARGSAIKRCTAEGRWFEQKHNGLSYEWTDYRPCLDKNQYLVEVYIDLVGNIISLTLLLPAIIIFLSFRELSRQQRVRLHTHFCVSLALNSLASILWTMLVHRDVLINPTNTQTIMYLNPVWCRVLFFFTIYLTSTNYFFMFCEGYYLHRLISNAFERPKRLVWLFVFGWAGPACAAIVYSIFQTIYANESCWARFYGDYKWIRYLPNLLCLLVNLVFLCNILRILMFQLHSHPHEPSNFRRGLKATFVLIPLFGLQLFFSIYHPEPGSPGEREFSYLTFLITSSQGIAVSLIFCFFNAEVIAQIKLSCKRRWSRGKPTRSNTQTLACSQATTIDGHLNAVNHHPNKKIRTAPSSHFRKPDKGGMIEEHVELRSSFETSPPRNVTGDVSSRLL